MIKSKIWIKSRISCARRMQSYSCNFDELTQQTSLDFYRRLFGRQISQNYLVASKDHDLTRSLGT